MRPTGMGPGDCRLQAHEAHQPLDPLAVDTIPLAPQLGRHLATAEEGRDQVLLVDESHQRQVLGALAGRLVIVRGPGAGRVDCIGAGSKAGDGPVRFAIGLPFDLLVFFLEKVHLDLEAADLLIQRRGQLLGRGRLAGPLGLEQLG